MAGVNNTMVTKNALSLQFEQHLLSMDKESANKMVQNEFTGNNAIQLIREIIMPALRSIELSWKDGTIPLSHELKANNACEEIVNSILPLQSPERKAMPTSAITTLGDEFLLGKQIVISFMKAAGFNIFDYGNMLVEDVVSKVQEDGIDIVLTSTRMPDFAYKVKDLKDRFSEEGISTKIIAGGAPFLLDDTLWKKLGADSMAADATEVMFRVYDVIIES